MYFLYQHGEFLCIPGDIYRHCSFQKSALIKRAGVRTPWTVTPLPWIRPDYRFAENNFATYAIPTEIYVASPTVMSDYVSNTPFTR